MYSDNPLDIRCPGGALHFRVVDGLLEIRCNNKTCTEGDSVVVYHHYSLPELELVRTVRLQDPFARRPRSPRSRKETR
ncbi:hypothetical protein MMAR_3889 [Mycobacterium marinum M]|uniref:Uncharacterized protein n=1 Tax=Mycobacterium marinum (strain ATCC BAA-535 / M) TaxID=216594 RepID=B2HNP8_MYCMM|nr:hypothetical protein MMAR_3889 [Mycobacterium marinum M]